MRPLLSFLPRSDRWDLDVELGDCIDIGSSSQEGIDGLVKQLLSAVRGSSCRHLDWGGHRRDGRPSKQLAAVNYVRVRLGQEG